MFSCIKLSKHAQAKAAYDIAPDTSPLLLRYASTPPPSNLA